MGALDTGSISKQNHTQRSKVTHPLIVSQAATAHTAARPIAEACPPFRPLFPPPLHPGPSASSTSSQGPRSSRLSASRRSISHTSRGRGSQNRWPFHPARGRRRLLARDGSRYLSAWSVCPRLWRRAACSPHLATLRRLSDRLVRVYGRLGGGVKHARVPGLCRGVIWSRRRGRGAPCRAMQSCT